MRGAATKTICAMPTAECRAAGAQDLVAARDLAAGPEMTAALVMALPQPQRPSGAASRRLAHYLTEAVRHVDAQSLAAFAAGEVEFPGPTPGEELGDA